MTTGRAADSDVARTFDWDAADGPSQALLLALAAERDADPAALPPLYSVVDADALDGLFGRSELSGDPVNGSVRFDYAGYEVVVRSNGRGYLYERAEHGEAGDRSADGVDSAAPAAETDED